MESDCERVRIILEQEFLEAIKRRDLASFRFSDATRDIPSGLPHPDGKQRIYSTSREYSAALNELIRALKRLTDFRDRGIVPEDLKAPPPVKSSTHQSGTTLLFRVGQESANIKP